MTPLPRLRSLSLAACLVAVSVSAAPADKSALNNSVDDPRVQEQLSAAGLRFSADEDGDALVRFRIRDGEEQSLWVASSTSRIRDLEVRDAFATAVAGSGPVPEGLFEDLLLRNDDEDFGAWEWRSDDEEDTWVVAFRAKLPARMTPEALKAALRRIAKTAAEFRAGFKPADAPDSPDTDETSDQKRREDGGHNKLR